MEFKIKRYNYPDCEKKQCPNCGCPEPQKTYDGYWCKWCKTEI